MLESTEPLSGKSIKRLAQIYEQRVLRTPGLAPEGMPELTARYEWKNATDQRKAEIVNGIKQLARESLEAAGYPRAKVHQIIN